MHDVTSNGIYPEDYYTHSHYYNAGESYDNESHGIIRSKKGRPNNYVTIYRAIPKNSPKGTKINPGDWITINRKYAHDHGLSNLGGKGNYRIISKNLRANEIYTDGNLNFSGSESLIAGNLSSLLFGKDIIPSGVR